MRAQLARIERADVAPVEAHAAAGRLDETIVQNGPDDPARDP